MLYLPEQGKELRLSPYVLFSRNKQMQDPGSQLIAVCRIDDLRRRW
jgi:hypothetical protein